MMPPSATVHDGALSTLECGLTAVAVVLPFAWPRLGHYYFARIESAFGRFARRKTLTVVSVGLSALFLRLAILPVFPVPLPSLPNDFSFLLAADTFAHGRLANPTPAMWTHFESVHISMQPTYMSMYFPGEGLLLAAGKVLLGHPWYGVLVSSALMCAGICWMLQAWLPPGWALLGGVLSVLRLGLFSYWVNTFSGAGAMTALGGALVLGSLPRLKKTAKSRYGLLMATGVILLVLTRPWEGMLLCLSVAVVIGHWVMFGEDRPQPFKVLKLVSIPLALIVAALVWLGYYDYRAFGNPLTLPYTINRATYATAPYFVWQPLRPEPFYRHEEMRLFYEWESKDISKVYSPASFVPSNLKTAWRNTQFFAGFALLPPLLMLPRLFLDRRIRFLMLCVLVLMAASSIMMYVLPHYLAPFTAAFYAIGLQAMRHLRLWAPEGRPAGAAIVRLTVTLCVMLAGLRLFAGPLELGVPQWSSGGWFWTWAGPEHFGTERAGIENYLEHLPGKQLAIVRYAHKRVPQDQWVYNSADIDVSKVVWAGEVDPGSDRELLNYYCDRKAWMIEPDQTPARVSPYPILPPLAGSKSDCPGDGRKQTARGDLLTGSYIAE